MKQKNFFLISFLPALAYWYLEENYSLQVALIGGLILAVLEMTIEWIFTRHIHTLSKFNFFLILILGGVALIAQEGIWFKLQPTFTGVLMGGYLLFRVLRGNGLMREMMDSMQGQKPDEKVLYYLERNTSFFLIVYGLFMAIIAFKSSTSQWLFFKTAGFYIASIIFFIGNIVFIKKLKR